MANYEHMLVCPNCGIRDLNLLNYNSLMVLRRDLGLFSLICQNCSAKITSVREIPKELVPEIEIAAKEIGAGGFTRAV